MQNMQKDFDLSIKQFSEKDWQEFVLISEFRIGVF